MREENIVIYPFTELKIDSYSGMQQVNEHAYVKLGGYIPYDKKEEYIRAEQQNIWISIEIISGECRREIFNGIIERLDAAIKGLTCRVEILIKSGTALLDYGIHTRSFQDIYRTYSEVLGVCNEPYENARATMSETKDGTIDRFVMQYKETDWEFAKRLARTRNTELIADISQKGARYYFGIPDREEVVEEEKTEYAQSIENGNYSFSWEDREIFNLGDCGIIRKNRMYIWRIETRLIGNELYHRYYMKKTTESVRGTEYNEHISGVSLVGKVKAVKGECIQIILEDDENRTQDRFKWFPYASVYSSEDGTGWYCMPEIGDRVRLYFPTEKDEDSYAIGAYHEYNAELRTDPKKKFWRNKEGKEIQLSPGKILLTNNAGTYVELSDEKGIEIVSAGAVSVSAEEVIRIASENSLIELSAPDKIKLRQGETEMNLGGDLNLSGAQIKL